MWFTVTIDIFRHSLKILFIIAYAHESLLLLNTICKWWLNNSINLSVFQWKNLVEINFYFLLLIQLDVSCFLGNECIAKFRILKNHRRPLQRHIKLAQLKDLDLFFHPKKH